MYESFSEEGSKEGRKVGSDASRGLLTLGRAGREVGRSVFGNSERRPARRREMFGDVDDLTNMVGGVGDGSVQRFDYQQRLVPDVNRAREVFRRECLDRRHED